MKAFWASLAAALLPALAPAPAQSPPWRLTHLGSEHGLSHNSVYAILEDRQGFLWVGTVDGLNRYDGYEFKVYRPDPADQTSLSNQVVRALLEDRNGQLWVGTEDGLDRLDRRTGRFAHYPLSGEEAAVWALFEEPETGLWVGTGAGAFRYLADDDRFVPVPLLARGAVRDFAGAPDGVLWALVEEDPAGAFHFVSLTGEPGLSRPSEPAWAFAIDRQGRFLTNTPEGAQATAAELARDGAVWIGAEGALCHSAGGEAAASACAPLVRGGSWLDNYVRAIHQDGAGGWWIGTYTGLYRFDPEAKPFVHLEHDPASPAGLGSNAVSAIWEDGGARLWVGTFGAGLDLLDRRTGRAVHFRHRRGHDRSLCGDNIWTLHGEPRSRLWVGTEEGLCSLDPARREFRTHPYPETLAPGRRRVLDLAEGRDGRMWMSSDGGLYSIDVATGSLRRVAAIGNVETLTVGRDGEVWLAQADVLRRFDPVRGELTEVPLRGPNGRALSSEGIWTIHQDSAGLLWLGTGSGLLRFDPQSGTLRQYSTRDGLAGSVVYSILEDDAGRLWLGTNRGLSRFDPRRPEGERFRNFGLADGIGSLEFNRRAAFRSRSGLFFGGVDGLLSFDPEAIREDERPARPALTAVEIGRRDGVERRDAYGLDRLDLEPRDEWFAFEFSALSFADPAKNLYAHRLEGLEEEWIELGTRRVARYTSVPPGEYTFRVRAANHDGVWSEATLALPIVVRPPFWRTPWFAALAVLTLGAAGYGLERLRVARLLAVERLRLRIAGDLHDDLSTDLSSIALAADLVRRRSGLDEESRQRLGEMRERAVRMVEAVRDTVWAVNPQHDSWPALIHRMRATANSLLGESLSRFDVAAPPADALGMAERRTLYLLFKEALHNVARHARASRVEISLRQPESVGLELVVRDDGVGFDPATATSGSGLDSLRRRAAQLGGELRIDSAPRQGTTVVFRKSSRKSGMARLSASP